MAIVIIKSSNGEEGTAAAPSSRNNSRKASVTNNKTGVKESMCCVITLYTTCDACAKTTFDYLSVRLLSVAGSCPSLPSPFSMVLPVSIASLHDWREEVERWRWIPVKVNQQQCKYLYAFGVCGGDLYVFARGSLMMAVQRCRAFQCHLHGCLWWRGFRGFAQFLLLWR